MSKQNKHVYSFPTNSISTQIFLILILGLRSVECNPNHDSGLEAETINLTPYSHHSPINISSILLLHDAIAIPNPKNSTTNIELTVVSNGIRSLFCYSPSPIRIFCHTDNDIRMAHYDCLPEDHQQNYTGVLIFCGNYTLRNDSSLKHVQIELHNLPSTVSESQEDISDLLLISHSYRPSKTPEMAVFVRPIFGKLKMRHFREFVAFHLVNGFKRIVVYTYNLHETQALSGIRGVELVEYRIPESVCDRIHAGGQLGAIHHFWLSNIDNEQLYVDLDEFVFVRNSVNFQPMPFYSWIDVHFRGFPTTYESLTFCTRLFCNERNNLTHSGSLLLDRQNAQSAVHPHKDRSKIFVLNARSIRRLQIHEIHSFMPFSDVHNLNIDVRLGDVHHYRSCTGLSYPNVLRETLVLQVDAFVDDSFERLSRTYNTRQRILELMNEK